MATRLSLREVHVRSWISGGIRTQMDPTELLCVAGQVPAPLCALVSPAEQERLRQSVPTPGGSVGL